MTYCSHQATVAIEGHVITTSGFLATIMHNLCVANGESTILENREALNQFFVKTERKAFRMAEIATRNKDHALDIVQDAMLALVKNYSTKSEAEWAPLFHRILQSKIKDWYRRGNVRNRVFGWFGIEPDLETEVDPLQQAPDTNTPDPLQEISQDYLESSALNALKKLPLRQQQTFMLRSWEGYSIEETADIMRISQGSVKTHYSRAMNALKQYLDMKDYEN